MDEDDERLIDQLMATAHEHDEEDEIKRETIQGKFCVRDQIPTFGGPTVSRNYFHRAKEPGKRVIFRNQ